MPALMTQRSSPGLNKIRRELKNRKKAVTAPKGGVAKRSSALPPPVPLGQTAPITSASTGAATVKLVDSTKRGLAKNCSCQPFATARAAAPRKIDYIPMGEIIQRCTAPPRVEPIFRTALSPEKPPSPCPVSSINSSCSSSKTAMPVLMARRPSAELTKGGNIKKSSSSPSRSWVHKGMIVKVRRPVETLPRTGKRIVLWLSSVVVSDTEDGYIQVIYNGYSPGDDRFRTVRVAMDDVKHMPIITEN